MEFKDLTILGERVIVKLDRQDSHTVTEYGIVVPQFQNVETDGGRPKAVASDNVYLPKGTIAAMSKAAYDKLKEANTPLEVGDKVYVTPSACNPSYTFTLDRSQLVTPFEGYISISPILIECKINN